MSTAAAGFERGKSPIPIIINRKEGFDPCGIFDYPRQGALSGCPEACDGRHGEDHNGVGPLLWFSAEFPLV